MRTLAGTVVQAYDRNLGYSADEYHRFVGFGGDWRDSWWPEDYLELLARRWRLDRARSLLDVGCGAGHWGQRLAALLPPDARVSGVDHEPEFVESAKTRAAERGLADRSDYRVTDVTRLPFDDATFEMVTCQTVLMHVADPEATLAEMVRVVRPGGLIVTSEPNNFVHALVDGLAQPPESFEDTIRLLRLWRAVHLGKCALGHGDSSIGERLPGLFVQQDLADIHVVSNERCHALFPPYDSPNQRLDLQQMRDRDADNASFWGTKDTVRTVYEAGGGVPDEFDGLWDLLRSRERARLRNVEAGCYFASRGFLLYLVWGRRRC